MDLITICISTDVQHIMSPPSGQLHLTGNLKTGWESTFMETEGDLLDFPPVELGSKAVLCWILLKQKRHQRLLILPAN